jgi:hypothetical protein
MAFVGQNRKHRPLGAFSSGECPGAPTPGLGFLRNQEAMSSKTATPQERTATETIPSYVPLGTDTTGADHVHRTDDDTIHVITPGGDRETYAIDATPLPDWHAWLAHVADTRGWCELTTATQIAGAIGGH